ncbi:protein TIFY 8-like [Cucurbita maxima]|uniref:Protein TIFY n=1 Tax=Cucurbita maxima TaxID=3661 RepID=A0A6J1ITN4_CUCMA|nr:protein TIFY 8-like [Cucurbita maxima]XP_022981323.1 protein TIFY 8-like [Cucurbita maxima]
MAHSNAGYCSNGENKSTRQVQPLGNAIFHDFLGIRTKDASILSAAKTPDVSLSEASSPSSALASSSGGRGLLSAASDLASENQVGGYLEGVPFCSPRNEKSGPEKSSWIAGIKRSNPDSGFVGSYRNQIPHVPSDSLERSHTMKMLQTGPGGDRSRYNDNETLQTGPGGDRPRYNDNEAVYYSMKPPKFASYSLTQHSLGTRFNPSVTKWERPIPLNTSSAQNSPLGIPLMPRVHQVGSSSSREFNVAPSSVSQPAADEGSRTGMKSPGLLSSINVGNDGRHSSQMLLSCDKQKSKTEGLEYKSSNPPSQQGLDSNNTKMTIFYGGQAHVFDDVPPNKADIIMALAGSNGGSWSTALAPKLNVTGISSDQQSAKAYHGTIPTGRGVGDTLISTQTDVGNRPRSVQVKETREPVCTADPKAER